MKTLLAPSRIKSMLEHDLGIPIKERKGELFFEVSTTKTPVAMLMKVEGILTTLYKYGSKIKSIEFCYNINQDNEAPYHYRVKFVNVA